MTIPAVEFIEPTLPFEDWSEQVDIGYDDDDLPPWFFEDIDFDEPTK